MIQKTCDIDSTPSVCSGSLISPSLVLSALGCAQCHCCLKNDTKRSFFYEAFAILGAYEWKGIYQNLPYDKDFQVIKITDVKSPKSDNRNDLALLILESPAKLSKYVCPVLLPSPTTRYFEEKSEAVGWTYNLTKSPRGQIEVIAKLKKCNMRTDYITSQTNDRHTNDKYKWITISYLFESSLINDPILRVTCEPCEQDKGDTECASALGFIKSPF